MATTKRFRYRLYPTPSASEAMSRIVGCCRAVYNILLAENKEAYFKHVNEGGPRPEVSGFSLVLRIKDLKLDDRYLWLQEVSHNPLMKSALDLGQAYQNAFKRKMGLPKFKKRGGYDSACFQSARWSVKDGLLKLERMGEKIKIHLDRPLPDTATSCTIIREPDGKWYASFVVEVEGTKTEGRGAVGIDLGVKDIVVTSDGRRIEAPKHLRRKELRLKRYDRAMRRKQKGSANRHKARLKLARAHAHIRRQRLDFCHNTARELVNEYRVIGLEQLAVKNIVRNHRVAKSAMDASLGLLVKLICEKAKESGHCHVVRIGRFTRSTQTCSVCGHDLADKLKLSQRSWTCPVCRSHHDRDENAAQVIEQHALAYLEVKNHDLHWTEEGCIRSISDREAKEMKVLAQTFRP